VQPGETLPAGAPADYREAVTLGEHPAAKAAPSGEAVTSGKHPATAEVSVEEKATPGEATQWKSKLGVPITSQFSSLRSLTVTTNLYCCYATCLCFLAYT
jgi:hypothetical protein